MAEDPKIFPIGERVVLARRAQTPELSQKELARRVGLSQQAIAELESGRIKRPSRLRELALVLDRSEAWLLGEAPLDPVQPAASGVRYTPNAGPQTIDDIQSGTVPIYGHAEGGMDGRFILNGETIGQTFRPTALQGVPRAYAVYVHGTSMSPRYEPGETVWVHPFAPVTQGDYVVVQIQPDRVGEPPLGFVKRFVSRNARRLVLEQLQPAEGESHRIEFDQSKVISVDKIVFSGVG